MHHTRSRALPRALCAVFACVTAACAALTAWAGDDSTAALAPTTIATPSASTSTCTCLPAGTSVSLEITERLMSDQRKAGEWFGFRLASPIEHNGVVLVPAGTVGRGEIVHAAPAGGSGKPGEFVLAARYLERDGARIALRAMKLSGAGDDRSGMVAGLSFAAGPFALFIHGGEIEIPAGTQATAKLAAPLPLPAALLLSSDASPDASSSSTKE